MGKSNLNKNIGLTIYFSTRKINEQYIKHIKDTCGVKNLEIIYDENDNKFSLTELYNKAIKRSKNNYICIIHDDLIFEKNSDWGKKIIKHFENSDYGILGKAGTTSLRESGKWWEESHLMIGSVYHTHVDPESGNKSSWESKYSGNFGKKIIPVVLVDGLFLAINKNKIKKEFDENFVGYHIYEIDWCINNFYAGVKIGVIFDFKLTHKSIGMTNEQWEENRKQLVNKWAFFTDENGEKKLGLPVSIEPTSIQFDEIDVKLKTEPKVAVIIPTKSKLDMLFKCLDSFSNKSKYHNYKIYIADTGSTDDEIREIEDYINTNSGRCKLIKYDYYNFAKINNDVVRHHIDADTEVLVFCNNDIELLNDALSVVVKQYVNYKNVVGTIGVRLHYPDKSLQHGGILMGVNREGHLQLTHRGLKSYYNYEPNLVINSFGSTGAFLLIPKERFDKSNGFDESYQECFEDVVLNIKQIVDGKINIFCGDAVCIHHESQSRGEGKQQREALDFNQRLIPFMKENIHNEKVRKHLKLI